MDAGSFDARLPRTVQSKDNDMFFFQSFKLVEVKERGFVVGMEYLSF